MNKETIQAIKDSIEHWKVDILEPLKKGWTISQYGATSVLVWILDETGLTGDLVKCRSSSCALCEIFMLADSEGCKKCPLTTINERCGLKSSSYMKFINNPCIETAEAMIETLESLLPEESK